MCAAPSGSWGGRRLSLGGSVTVMGATDGATAAGAPGAGLECMRVRVWGWGAVDDGRPAPAARWGEEAVIHDEVEPRAT